VNSPVHTLGVVQANDRFQFSKKGFKVTSSEFDEVLKHGTQVIVFDFHRDAFYKIAH
jgi:hypothetical protein